MVETASTSSGRGERCRSRRHHDQAAPPLVRRGLRICVDCRNLVEEHLVALPEWYEICAHMLDFTRSLQDDPDALPDCLAHTAPSQPVL